MWLINTKTLELEEAYECPRNSFAILSHTWGLSAEEVTFDEFKAGNGREKVGFRKIRACCEQAQRDRLQHAWIDTCCINKSSSTELSEAINSMFQWYAQAKVCYVYLADVSQSGPFVDAEQSLLRSRWFTRGWTLQELIAPKAVSFFSREWTWIGDKTSLAQDLQVITDIPVDVLISRKDFLDCSLAQRMSWASKRQTTRVEDSAYCLLGLFNVSMPLLYGEGPKAFLRLQEIIIEQTDDETIFTWADVPAGGCGLLAPSPAHFLNCAHVQQGKRLRERPPYAKTNRGWSLEVQVLPYAMNVYVVPLQCTQETADSKTVQMAIFICRTDKEDQYRRVSFSGVCVGTVTDYQTSRAKVVQVLVPDDGRGLELMPHSGLPCLNVGSNLRCWRVLRTKAEVLSYQQLDAMPTTVRDLESGFAGESQTMDEYGSGTSARASMKTMEICFQRQDLERGVVIVFERPGARATWFYHYLQIGFDVNFSPVCVLHRRPFEWTRHPAALNQQVYMIDRMKASVLPRLTSTTSLWKLDEHHFGSFKRSGVLTHSFMWAFKGSRFSGLQETIKEVLPLNYGCTDIEISCRPQQDLVWDLKFREDRLHRRCHWYGVFCGRRWSRLSANLTPLFAPCLVFIMGFYHHAAILAAIDVWYPDPLPSGWIKSFTTVSAIVLSWLCFFFVLAPAVMHRLYHSKGSTRRRSEEAQTAAS